MSSSDDFRDKQLRAHFQKVFDGLEQQPLPTAKERIFRQIPQKNRYRGYVLLSLSILLLIGVGVYVASDQLLLGPTRLTSQQPIGGKQSLPVRVHEPSQREAVTRANNHSHGFVEADRQKSPTSSPEVIQSENTEYAVDIQKQHRLTIRRPVIRRHSLVTIPQLTAQGSDKQQRLVAYSLRSQPSVHPEATPIRLVRSTADSIESEPVVWHSLRSLPLSLHTNVTNSINRRIEFSMPILPSLEQPTRQRLPVRWLAGITPLSTYQWMTVVARPETYVQHVEAPAAFSGQTWGYQLSGGLLWRQAVYQLSVGYIRRWAYYDLATSTFQVKSVGPNQYEVTRMNQPVAENVSLLMLGGSARKHWILGGPQSPYFVRLGGAFSYVPDTQQSLAWANASMGLSIPLTKAYQMQLGPTVEYGVSRLWSAQRQLIIRPYLVGATLSIQANNP